MNDIAYLVPKLSGASTVSNDHEIELNSTGYNPDDTNIDKNNESNETFSNKNSNSYLTKFRKIAKKLSFLNVEERGIERIPPDERTDSKIINTAMIWVGANIIMPNLVTGTLGPAVFNLTLYQSFVTIILFNVVGVIPVGMMACFGPPSGLRTMVFSRYSWGYYGASIAAIFTCINAVGWAAVNSITGAQALRVVSNDHLPMFVSIIIVGMASLIISFAGYRWVHIYERYCWIPMFIGYCIVAGVGAKYFTHSQTEPLNRTISTSTRLEASRVLSFGTTVYATGMSWCAFSGDYNTYFPENTSQLKVFFLTYFGNFIGLVLLQLLGAAVYTGTYTNSMWKDAYQKNNVGGLLGAVLSPLGGFGKFLLVLFSLSTIAGNIPNVYSLSLAINVIAPIFRRIPRIIYTIIGTVIYIILGSIAADRFNDSLISFMDIISYWFSLYIVVVFEEHLLFRHCSYRNYNFIHWDNRRLLPVSFAAILAGIVGIVGVILGMSQTWFSGPIAKAIGGNNGEHNADVGWELGIIFTAITYPLFRYIELHFLKR